MAGAAVCALLLQHVVAAVRCVLYRQYGMNASFKTDETRGYCQVTDRMTERKTEEHSDLSTIRFSIYWQKASP